MLVRQCISCKKLKTLAKFRSPINPKVCNECESTWIPPEKPRSIRSERNKSVEHEKDVYGRMVEFFEFYEQLPHVDFSQRDSLVLYTQVICRSIHYKYLNYQNTKYGSNFTTMSIKEVMDVIGTQIWRYITHKKCLGCRTYLPTYEGAENPDLVIQALTNSAYRPPAINFWRKYNKRDRLSNYCNKCWPAFRARDRRIPPWRRDTDHIAAPKKIIEIPPEPY